MTTTTAPARIAASQAQVNQRIRVYGNQGVALIWRVEAPYRRHGEVGTLHLSGPGLDWFLVCYGDETFEIA